MALSRCKVSFLVFPFQFLNRIGIGSPQKPLSQSAQPLSHLLNIPLTEKQCRRASRQI